MPPVLPPEIEIHEAEQRFVDPGLDFPYIVGLAEDIAGLLHDRSVAECVYQPGDGTRYPLVFVPLTVLQHGRGRTVGGRTWEHHAVSGMAAPGRDRDDVPGYRYYDSAGFLIAWIDHGVYPLRLGGRGSKPLAHEYVMEHWGAPTASAVSLALLFRAISTRLDKLAPGLRAVPSWPGLRGVPS